MKTELYVFFEAGLEDYTDIVNILKGDADEVVFLGKDTDGDIAFKVDFVSEDILDESGFEYNLGMFYRYLTAIVNDKAYRVRISTYANSNAEWLEVETIEGFKRVDNEWIENDSDIRLINTIDTTKEYEVVTLG